MLFSSPNPGASTQRARRAWRRGQGHRRVWQREQRRLEGCWKSKETCWSPPYLRWVLAGGLLN